jgi:hypothetical protein
VETNVDGLRGEYRRLTSMEIGVTIRRPSMTDCMPLPEVS